MSSPPSPTARPPAEAAPTRRRLPWADGAALAGLALISVAAHAWLYTHTFTTARDSIGFAQLALQYEDPARAAVKFPCATALDVVRQGEPPHPPGYPLIVLAVSKVVRAVATPADDGELAAAMLRSTQLASMLGALVLVVPSYFLGRRLFGPAQGFAAAALFQVLPVSARVTSDGLTEAWYLVFVAFGLGSGVIAVQANGVRGFFTAGLFGGLAYLVRPEGLLVSLTMGLFAVVSALDRRVGVPRALRRGLAVTLGTALIAGPYMAAIGGVTLKNAAAAMAGSVVAVPAPPPGPALFGATFDPGRDGSKLQWVAKAIALEATKTFHYAPLGFALIALPFAVRRLRTDPAVGVLLLLAGLNLAVVALLAAKVGYLSERHLLPIAFVGCFLAAYVMFGTRDFWRPIFGGPLTTPAASWVLYAVIFASCLPATAKPLHEDRHGHRVLGEYLKANATPEDVILDPYNWAQFYSGRSVRGVPPDPPAPRYRWAVLEEGEKDHATFTKPRLTSALNVARDQINKPVVALEWSDPADSGKARKIVLYRQDASK